ncbi:uncharacterized protein SCHCODRAFT_01298284 [Schizophyllum commune H4-8]|uniref:uncharacterized protein n=1 Tax=Schizophyllum commune (strain H4-8 / FGSC 9210) TaxID=578458 RepID=UPI00215F12F4|nr:uncharacterized protein SCHCODRAFT_01298284 [Schizophyllum commune H4-8]KAI5892010.1 hypothetical protein SCHCODRAFT_01298284 [Schizophyllum commune H4-8]
MVQSLLLPQLAHNDYTSSRRLDHWPIDIVTSFFSFDSSYMLFDTYFLTSFYDCYCSDFREGLELARITEFRCIWVQARYSVDLLTELDTSSITVRPSQISLRICHHVARGPIVTQFRVLVVGARSSAEAQVGATPTCAGRLRSRFRNAL